ncbi:MAG: hypothetical protein ACRYGF_08205 [Janthinobacterium lividum]
MMSVSGASAVSIVSGLRFRFPVANAGTKDQIRLRAGLDLSAELMAIEGAKIFLVDRWSSLLQ